MLSLNISLTNQSSPIVLSPPSFLGSSYATTEGSPNLPDITFNSTNPFVLAEVALPPQAGPPLMTYRADEGVSGQYERSESFEFVSLPLITAGNWARNHHVEVHA